MIISNQITYIGTSPNKNPKKGEMYYNKVNNKIYLYNGMTWIKMFNYVEENLYFQPYTDLCIKYPDKKNLFNNILLLCNNDYEKAFLIITDYILK